MRMRPLVLTAVVTAALIAVPAAAASAHPLGNFTVNRFSGIVVSPDSVTIDHILDLAEVPTVQVNTGLDIDRDGTGSSGRLAKYARSRCAAEAAGMQLSAGGTALGISVGSATARELPGQAGLPTLRITCRLQAPLTISGRTAISFRDSRTSDGVGWREITAQGDQTTIERSDVRAASISRKLSAYPADLLSSPPDQRSAEFTVRPGGTALQESPPESFPGRPADRLSDAFAGLTGKRDHSLPFAALALLLALGIGAAHALAPGHGKTVMAFYLTGRGQNRRQAKVAAITVGATVTATHTAGVLTLGVLISSTAAIAPASVYPWLAAVSGVLIVAVGTGLLRDSLRARRSHAPMHSSHGDSFERELVAAGHAPSDSPAGGHSHPQRHAHPHPHSHSHPHPPGHSHSHSSPPPRPRGLVAMGLAGGLVPSPTALVVLLGAAAAGRAWFGVLLVIAFGVGMAATLAATGLLVVAAGDRLASFAGHGRYAWISRVTVLLPLLAAAGVCGLGAAIVLKAFSAVLA